MKISRNGRFWVATILWCAVAVMLIVRGFNYAWGLIESDQARYIALAIAVVAGAAKGMFVISKSAARNAGYIARRPEKDWFWLCFHPVMYILIPVMIGMGIALRVYALESAPAVVLAVYVGIGVALLVGVKGLLEHKKDVVG